MSQKSYDGSNSVYLIPTPIGNFDDITLRTIDTLKLVDVLFCEDTRITKQMLNRLEINKKLISSNDHNEETTKNIAIKYLEEGKNIGIVTDRGTPIISDPGYKVVEEVIKRGYNVIPLPGANALIPALIASGVNPSPFMFYGFLNAKPSERKKELESLKTFKDTMIFYQSPHKILACLTDMLEILGDRQICLCRELTKKFEEYIRGTISEIIPICESLKGEMVLVVKGYEKENENIDISFDDLVKEIDNLIDQGNKTTKAIKMISEQYNVSRSELYQYYHELKER